MTKCICLLAAVAMLASAPAAHADFRHVVVKGESIQGIAHKYNVDLEELLKRNPQANKGVREKMVLIIPEGDSQQDGTIPGDNGQSSEQREVPSTGWAGIVFDHAEGILPDWEEVSDTLVVEEDTIRRPNLMVLLPFTAEPAKKAKQYAEFYRGMLIAANELTADRGVEVEVIVKDMSADPAKLADQLSVAEDKNVSVIIAPEDPDAMRSIIDYAEPRGIYVLNMFNLKDESHLTRPFVLQGYIDAQMMYAKAVGGILNYYDGYTPVILNPENGRQEKDPFVQMLRKKYVSMGLDVIDVSFTENLRKSDLEAAGVSTDGTGKYVFICRSGAVAVFNRFAPMISELRMTDEGKEAYQLFGYPDWTAFRGEHLTRLYDLQAMVYSRFFFNEKSVEARALRNSYERWYGESMLEAVPNQAALGYDTATTFVEWLQQTDGNIESALNTPTISRGIQSSFSFVPAGIGAGYINNTLYLVKFLPDRTTESIVL